jgi:hypothetical protein
MFREGRDGMGCPHVAALVTLRVLPSRPHRLVPVPPSAIVESDDLVGSAWGGHPAEEA